MDAGVWEIFGTRYYSNGFGLLLVAPFAFWFVVSLIGVPIRAIERKPVKWYGLIISLLCTLVMLVVVFWDVYQIGQQATKLCNEKAGLHVYRTAEAEGVLGLFSIEHWSKYGFKFVEYEDVLKNKTRYFLEGGKPAHKKVNQFLSQYELLITRKKLTPKIKIHQYQIIERSTNEILGETAHLRIDGGWADMAFYGLTGFTYTPWQCKGDGMEDASPIDIVKVVLKPIH